MTSGIYLIKNTVSPLYYVGQSSDIRRRWRDHRRLLGGPDSSQTNQRLWRSWQKYGPEAFEFIILEECPTNSVTGREQFWLDVHRSTFGELVANAAGPVDSPTLGRHHTDEAKRTLATKAIGRKQSALTKEKKRVASARNWENPEYRTRVTTATRAATGKPEWRARRSDVSKETNSRPEVRQKISTANKGRIVPAHCLAILEQTNKIRWSKPGSRAEASVAARARWDTDSYRSAIEKAVLDTSSGEQWESLKACAAAIGVHRTTVCQHLRGKTKKCAGRSLAYRA